VGYGDIEKWEGGSVNRSRLRRRFKEKKKRRLRNLLQVEGRAAQTQAAFRSAATRTERMGGGEFEEADQISPSSAGSGGNATGSVWKSPITKRKGEKRAMVGKSEIIQRTSQKEGVLRDNVPYLC